jgi:hypothetical protein
MGAVKAEDLRDLPGWELVGKGLDDHAANISSPEACLVRMASPRLVLAGLMAAPPPPVEAEVELYQLLAKEHPGRDVFPLYNSLCRRLVRFERALDHFLRRARQPHPKIPA